LDETRNADPNVWRRLRSNRERNSRLFYKAGFRPELSREVDCSACGAQETALFWTVTRADGPRLHLLCPICEKGAQVYRMGGDRQHRRRVLAAAIAGATLFGVSGLALLVHEIPPAERAAWMADLGAMDVSDAAVTVVGGIGRSIRERIPGVDAAPSLPGRRASSRSGGLNVDENLTRASPSRSRATSPPPTRQSTPPPVARGATSSIVDGGAAVRADRDGLRRAGRSSRGAGS
jgi:hypothetical protein